MKNNNRWIIMILLAIAVLALSACGSDSVTAKEVKPAQVQEIEGSEFKQVILTEKAAERLGIQTAQVSEEEGVIVVPYNTVIYGLHGETWLYTNPEPLTYVRYPITIDRIDGGLAILSEGPALGTAVVTVGVAELYGEETGIKK